MQSHEQRRAAGNSAPTTDSNFKQTVLLLHGDGTNGGQNNTFVDSSTNNFTITRNGNTTQGSFSPFSQTGWSNYFDGTGDYLSFPSSTNFAFGTGDFTVEAWVYITTTQNFGTIFLSSTTGLGDSLHIQINSSNKIRVTNNSTEFLVATNAITTSTWTHIAVVRNGTTLTIYQNGTSNGSVTNSTSFIQSGAVVGYEMVGGSFYLTGYISNLRVVKGTAVYTSGFTPSTTPLTAITNTSLLTCQSNRFIDNSSNAFAITVSGDTKVRPFSPFAPTVEYSTSSIGGSAYFDGAGDYLGIANDNVFDTDTTYTFEAWFYQPTAGDGTIFGRGGGAASWSTSNGHQFLVFIQTGAIYTQFNSSGSPISISTTAPVGGAWHHVAVGYNGTTTRMWLNGASVGTSTAAYTMPTTRNIIRIGYSPSSGTIFTGYISGARFVKGTDVYGVGNTSITVPTAPLTAITNTSLLCNFTNAAIFDNTAKNDLETVGNAQISTSTKKYGTGSLYFDGTGDSLLVAASADNVLTGDFTIEYWINPVNNTGVGGYSLHIGSAVSTNATYFGVKNATSYAAQLSGGGEWLVTGTPSTSTWSHIAWVRSGSTLTLYVNGTSLGTTTTSANAFSATIGISIGNAYATGEFYLNGYIDDLRITKGVARYTSNFTAPTAAFANK